MRMIILFMLTAFTVNGFATNLSSNRYNALFKGYEACFMLYNATTNKIQIKYDPAHKCEERIAPDSTFKVALSLMAFDQQLINQNTVFKWDGQKRELENWNQDQTPKTWLTYSALWVSQFLTPQLGMDKIKRYLADFHYGNQDMRGDAGLNNGITHAWLSSSLKISADEQLTFMRALLDETLPISHEAMQNTKQNMISGKLSDDTEYYAKTGSGWHGRNERLTNPSKLRDGWMIGFFEFQKQQYIFVSNLTDKQIPKVDDKRYGSQILKPIVLTILNDYVAP